jgi:hypothetical protein
MNRFLVLNAAALLAVVALAGCKKKEAETATVPPPAATLAIPPPPAGPITMPAPAPSSGMANIVGLELGTSAGADMKIATPTRAFATKDKMIAAVTTRTNDANATVPARVGVRWTHADSNQTANEETRDLQLKGEQTWDFEITNPEPWPTGNYRAEVLLDGTSVQTRTFTVK